MRVLLAVLLVGIAGCGGGDNSPDDVAAPSSSAKAAGIEDLSDAELADLLQELVEQPGAGLVHLKGMTKLETLSLIGPKITDAGLVHLKGLTGLQSLYLSGTKVTETGIADLQKVLPNCKISK